MNQEPGVPSQGITRFIPGLALSKGWTRAAPHGTRRGRHRVRRARAVGHGLRRSGRGHARRRVVCRPGAMVMYALFGTSRQLITGPEATTAIMVAAAVAPLAGGDPVRYAALAALAALLVG
jgi:hypothetical protein